MHGNEMMEEDEEEEERKGIKQRAARQGEKWGVGEKEKEKEGRRLQIFFILRSKERRRRQA